MDEIMEGRGPSKLQKFRKPDYDRLQLMLRFGVV